MPRPLTEDTHTNTESFKIFMRTFILQYLETTMNTTSICGKHSLENILWKNAPTGPSTPDC